LCTTRGVFSPPRVYPKISSPPEGDFYTPGIEKLMKKGINFLQKKPPTPF